MKFSPTVCLLTVLLSCGHRSAGAEIERHYFNDLPAPESVEDLVNIETALKSALPEARAATICLELGEEKGSGSGVIVSEDGLILTAAHVTGGVNRSIEAVLDDGTRYPVRTMGLISGTDAAMAQIEGEGPFPFVEVDRDKTTLLGDWVMSLGHSGGYDEERGVVVRLGRVVRMAQRTWQTDGTLIGGDSGGPLFNLHGSLIGIHSRVGKVKGENLHVPIDNFLENWDALLSDQFVGDGPFAKRQSGLLGVVLDFDEEAEEVFIKKVAEGLPADKAGLLEGDVLLRLGDEKIESVAGLQESLKKTTEGDSVSFAIRRNDQEQVVELKVGGRE